MDVTRVLMQDPSCSLLAEINGCIDGRIDELRAAVSRMERTRQVLRGFIAEDRALKAQQAQSRVLMEQEADQVRELSSDKSAESPFDQLDGILSLAREIRASSIKSKPKMKSVDSEGARTGRSRPSESSSTKNDGARAGTSAAPARQGDASDQAQHAPSSSARGVDGTSGRSAQQDDVLLQIKFLSRWRVPTPVSSLCLSKSKYCEEAHFWSAVRGRKLHPSSAVYDVISSSLSRVLPEETSGAVDSSDNVLDKLTSGFKNLIRSYEAFAKSRLVQEGFNVAQLSKEDRVSLIGMWYKGRRLLELYEHFVSTRRKQRCTCGHCARTRENQSPQNISRTLLSTALYAPLPLPSTIVGRERVNLKFGAKVQQDDRPSLWSSAALRGIDDFHRTFTTRVQLAVESTVGQHQLKTTIQALRGCCEAESAERGNRDAQRQMETWTEPLKLYRAVYSILISEARNLDECVFLNK
ncbi:hypothetical protein B484DRAFT_77113 [Ochromonadaceae sp. CCMP2298]|nr:hypothetical protein B484DRAFT_77113 [Ochromonadaceae sp. CCMP2298]|mmetsp:Transcript_14898/g.32893  ORF Transcript_14898/g.32893 Transcript_14898/m.32893 type:complete len:468 (-) Transcript_14898:33-1436(-)